MPTPKSNLSGTLKATPASWLEDVLVCYAANAVTARGGQGEYLRQMVYALDQLPHGRVLSRRARPGRAASVDIPFEGWRAGCFQAIKRVPVLRRRQDLLTLLSDVDFDSRVRSQVAGVELFNGVMGQCSETFEFLSGQRVPLVLTALNTHIDNVAGLLDEEHRRLGIETPSFIHPAMRRRVRSEIERASCIQTISNLAKGSFIERGVPAEKIEVVLPAVDLDYFHPVAKTDGTFRVLAVLTIDPRKGAYYLLQAFEKAAIPGSELVIIGATGDRWSKKMLAQFMSRMKNVRIQSADVFREPIEATYGQASVVVHPAIEDGFALAVGQALACGRPVITTRNTGAAEVIVDGRNGYVLEPRDVDGLVDRLRLLARDQALLSRLSAAAPHAVAHLGYPQFAGNMARLYSRAFEAHSFPDRVKDRLLAGLPEHYKYQRGMISMEASIANLRRNGFDPASIVDVGAFQGDWSRMVRRIYPQTPISMLEANPEQQPVLSAAVAEIGAAELHIALLGPKAAPSVPFHVMGTGSSVLPENTRFPRSIVELPMTTLDRVLSGANQLPGPYFLKLDVQGFELEVLRGAEQVLVNTEAALLEVALLEYNAGAPLFAEVVAFMAARNFVVYDVSGYFRRESDDALFVVDLLFVREASPLRSKKPFFHQEAQFLDMAPALQ
jgi:FkbM family methyltransferase